MLEKFVLLGLCGLVSCCITCPGGQMKCKDQATCCLTEQGYRCCPYPDGVCCADLAHCCPSGYQCNLVTQMCERRWESRPMLRTGLEPADGTVTALEPALRGVIRCDSSFYCSKGFSCCKGPTGQWSCCPYPLATCCADRIHCCQYGYTCDPDSQVCRSGPLTL